MTYDELVEAVAKKQWQRDTRNLPVIPWEEVSAVARHEYMNDARTVIPIVQEACAGVAGRHFDGLKDANAYQAAASAIARAIRNMGDGS